MKLHTCTYLLDLLLISLLQSSNVIGSLLGLLDLLPSLHLLLLEQGDSIGQQLRITLDTTPKAIKQVRISYKAEIVEHAHVYSVCSTRVVTYSLLLFLVSAKLFSCA